MRRLRIVILGLSITSSWGNGHATTYRSLMRALLQRGHDVLFLERDAPWYRTNRDPVDLPPGSVHLYHGIDELHGRWRGALADADLVIIGSYVPEGIGVGALVQSIGSGIVAFYDIDTPVTLASLALTSTTSYWPASIFTFPLPAAVLCKCSNVGTARARRGRSIARSIPTATPGSPQNRSGIWDISAPTVLTASRPSTS
jgi:spore maturation protein CgeB